MTGMANTAGQQHTLFDCYLLWPTPQASGALLVDCYGQHRRGACDVGRREVVLPTDWDRSIRFTDRLLLDEAVLGDDQWAIHRALHAPPRPTRAVRIGLITRVGHPCVGQRGLFATAGLAVGTRLINYSGVAKPYQGGDDGGYVYALKGLACSIQIDIDAGRAGNESRYINDYRGTGAGRPNVQFMEERNEAGELEVYIEVEKPIAALEEILISYGSGYF